MMKSRNYFKYCVREDSCDLDNGMRMINHKIRFFEIRNQGFAYCIFYMDVSIRIHSVFY